MTINKYKNYIKTFSLLLMIVTSFCLSAINVFAANTDTEEVTFQISAMQQGNPAALSTVAYENVQTAYENIMKGAIPVELEKTVLWNTALSAGQNSINLGGELQLGKGITHTSDEAKKIIQILFQSHFEIFQFLNGMPNESGTSLKSLTTDENGQGSGQIKKGLLAVINDNIIINLTELKADNQQLLVNLDGSNSGVVFEFTGLPDGVQSAGGTYVVENNYKIGYKITVSKELLRENGQVLMILTPPNIVIDSASVPLEKKSLLPQVIPNSYYKELNVTGENYELFKPQIFATTSEQLKSTFSNENYYNLPQSTEDIVVTGELSISPNITEKVNFLFDTIPLTAQLTLHSFNMQEGSNVKQPSNFQIIAQVGEGTTAASATSAPLSSAGINFVLIDGEKNKLVSGAQYVLGKKEDNKYYISSYSGWKEVKQKDLLQINPNDYIVMSGGNIYNLGENQAIPMSVNPQNWDRDFQGIQSRNQSLLGIRGLGQGKQYFIMQIKAPEGYNKIDQPYYFTVYNDKDNLQLRRNTNSIGFADIQATRLNGQIPGYVAGTNEFNALSVTSNIDNLKINVKSNIIIPIAFIVLVIILVGIFLIWKF